MTTHLLGLCLLAIPLLGRVWISPTREMSVPVAAPVARAWARSPSAEARRAAWRGWMRAQEAVSRECEALEEWEPGRGDAGSTKTAPQDAALRRQLLAADHSGELGWAHLQAQVAAALARTSAEKYAAAVLLARIECDAGDPRAELEQARRLMALAPHRRSSLLILWRAARCNGLEPVARRADAALRTLPDAPN
jgi:hypothetical protein